MALLRSLRKRRRIVMDLERCGVPGIPLLGRYNLTKAQPALLEHLHGGVLEICYLVRGVQSYQVGNRLYRLRGGDLFMTFPGERHSTGGFPEERGELYWMMIRAGSGDLLGLEAPQKRALFEALRNVSERQFPGTPGVKLHLDAITGLHAERRGPLNTFFMRSHAMGFLREVLSSSRTQESSIKRSSLAPLLQHIGDAPEDNWTIPRMADIAGLSVSHFKARFKEETGVPPAEYVLRLRIDAAKRLLAQGRGSVTEVAYDLGFSSSQYFATVFKRFTGMAPRDTIGS